MSPDLELAWKDEESFHAKIGVPGYWTESEASAVLRTAAKVAELVQKRIFPFSEVPHFDRGGVTPDALDKPRSVFAPARM